MKNRIVFLGLLFCTVLVFAQEVEEIELPDVTTVINGENIKAGLDSLPDFEDVLIVQEGSGDVVPQLPDVELKGSDGAIVESDAVVEKSIYAEGQLGGGYPSLFTGDFSVYRMDGISPFSLNFHHNSASGYSGKALAEGYNDRDTSMSVEKTIVKNKFNFTFGGLYETMGLGLQNKVDNISNYDNDLIKSYGKFSWELPKNFTAGANIDAGFYNRYADITSAAAFAGPENVKKLISYDITPTLFGSWNGNGFNIDLDGSFWFGGINPAATESSQRGDFGLGLCWANDIVNVFGNVDVVFGSCIQGESVVVPFNVGVETAIPVYFSNRKITLELGGGLDSYRNSIYELEKMYKYTSCAFIPSETSSWFGKLDFSLPLKTSFTGNVVVDFRKTAFDNGILYPDYSSTAQYGLYGYSANDVTLFTTQFNIAYHYKLLSLTAGWHSNWMDIPALESSQMILLNVSLQSEESKWGVNLLSKICFGENTPAPVISVDGFVRLTPAVRIVLAAEDIIKLVTGETRTYAGQYIAQGGNVSLLVKFFF